MLKIIKPKDHAEWLAHRQAGIGSSEVATIVGLNPYETPYQLWRRKKGLDPAKEETFLMKAGHYLEDAVSKFWADETGHRIIKSSAGDWIAYDSEKPWMRVSPDREFYLLTSKRRASKGILECKTTQMHISEDDIPKHWFCQLQYQLGVRGLQHGALAWLTMGREFGHKEFAFVPAFFEWLEQEVTHFWQENILGDKEPELINTADALTKFHEHTEGKIIEATPELTEEIIKIKMLKNQKKAIEAELTEAEGKVKMAMLDAEALTFNGATLATWKSSKPSRKLDTKSIPESIAAQYMIEVPGTRRFNIK